MENRRIMDNNAYTFIDYAPQPGHGAAGQLFPDDHFGGGPGSGGRRAYPGAESGRMTRRTRETRLMPGSGSGFIISTDGFVVTNNHVIDMAEDIKVSLADGRTVTAELKGADPSTDIAVLKIDGTGLKALVFADSESLAAGTDRYRDRQSAGIAAYGDGRGSECSRADATGQQWPADRRYHPDGCVVEPGQFRGAAGQFAWTGHRGQYGDDRFGTGALFRRQFEPGCICGRAS